MVFEPEIHQVWLLTQLYSVAGFYYQGSNQKVCCQQTLSPRFLLVVFDGVVGPQKLRVEDRGQGVAGRNRPADLDFFYTK